MWHDILYDGPRVPGWPDDGVLQARARFLEGETGGGLSFGYVLAAFARLASMPDAPLPWVPAAVARWLEEQPDPATGLGRLERSVVAVVGQGCHTPGEIFVAAARAETPPQYWGDTTLWAKINALADREPPLLRIQGPAARLPQWTEGADLSAFRICAVDAAEQ